MARDAAGSTALPTSSGAARRPSSEAPCCRVHRLLTCHDVALDHAAALELTPTIASVVDDIRLLRPRSPRARARELVPVSRVDVLSVGEHDDVLDSWRCTPGASASGPTRRHATSGRRDGRLVPHVAQSGTSAARRRHRGDEQASCVTPSTSKPPHPALVRDCAERRSVDGAQRCSVPQGERMHVVAQARCARGSS